MEIRLGAVKVALWRHESESGVRHSATFSKIYRDGDKWQTTDFFGRDDLLLVAKVADDAHSWIFAHGRESGAPNAVPAPEGDANPPGVSSTPMRRATPPNRE